MGASREEARRFLAGLGEPPYRGDQVLGWVYERGVYDFQAMTDLPRVLREALAERAACLTSRVEAARRSADGTEKLLIRLADGQRVETVGIPEGERRTACLSTQVGCAFGCAFCASGLGGLVRDLAPGEIVEQALHARARVAPEARLTHLVVMGMGEPLASIEALLRALRIFTAPWGLGLSGRRITVSTVGLPAGIRRLAEEGPGVALAVSLHAADEPTRQRLVPRGGPLGEVVEAAKAYRGATGRDVTFEYALAKGVNDSADDARALADLVGEEPIFVNVIPLNPVAGVGLEPPPAGRVRRFVAELRDRGVRARERRQRGADIEAACGQLRRRAAGLLG
ncbi:MAG: 23S rRNA (adenine(2503)-C(2))-methyltransferase RlmN [Candidatus Brocadiia bacterium]